MAETNRTAAQQKAYDDEFLKIYSNKSSQEQDAIVELVGSGKSELSTEGITKLQSSFISRKTEESYRAYKTLSPSEQAEYIKELKSGQDELSKQLLSKIEGENNTSSSENTTQPQPKNNNIYRSSTGQVHTAGSVVFNNTFGQETMSMSSSHGHDITFAGQAASWFNPNNLQIRTGGNSFSDTQGYRSTYTKRDHYLTTGGTLTITTGAPRLFDKDDTTVSDYVKIRGELAAAQCSPYTLQGGKTNNSGATFEMKGSVDPESGSTEGKEFPVNPSRENYESFVKSKASQMLKLEQKMGEGGDLVLAAGKDVTFSAGTKAIAIDSGYINPVGAKIVKGYKIDGSQDKGKRAVPQYTSAPSYQEKDTFSNIPFGTLNLAGANRVMIKAGAGGFNVEGAGSIKLTGTGLSWLGGAQVNLISTGTTFMNSAALIATTNNFNIQSPESLFTGNVHVNQNTIIGGNLEVGGDLIVYGDIICKGQITADGDITAGGSGGISLLNHVHGGVQGGGSKTAKPQ